ncbi:ATP-binding cassette domain-containing protein [Nocardioides humi]|uniref:ABC transporter ATP-binding protein n=1 Tax=Nocardioides humi TaxID=449461 RepID=A0ABN1ZW13_9ACTN|nr:ATP-binding cassette domain-containing protein [Nocardioides humi]
MSTASLDGVSKTYGRTVALQPTTVSLQPGVVGLLGPNGAGKTTMLRLLSSALPPSSGRIVVAGHEVTAGHAERIEARRRIGYLPQEVVFPRGMTALGFLDYIAVLKEWKDAAARHTEIRRVLELVHLGDSGTRKVARLSGGQRRRLAIAQALIGSPELLILDEPTTGLDPEQRASLRGLLGGLPGTVLLSTHQTEDVSALCDRVLVIDDGLIRFDGSVPDLLATAAGRVHLGPTGSAGAVQTWKTGTGLIRSVGGHPAPDSSVTDPSVEDAYLLLRAERPREQGVIP